MGSHSVYLVYPILMYDKTGLFARRLNLALIRTAPFLFCVLVAGFNIDMLTWKPKQLNLMCKFNIFTLMIT